MDCPYCGKEMKKGRIPSRGHLNWYENTVEIGWDEGVQLNERFQDAQAFYCPDCRKVILPVPEAEDILEYMQRKLGGASKKLTEKLNTVRGQLEERRTQADQTKKRREQEKRGKKDPWEL